ncbi:hypothetical protein BN2476_750100 [Paraburkholderia piptadeniae]|uniref:Uncharacterized protein n=1 Tax=Paraburkholderia piptadeniae TaxID=1701573 RepID=A0A1N7ST82_9BURK|nr:hypothetical protein BN2476_750100 [Paraburkholderia piptadeniae]
MQTVMSVRDLKQCATTALLKPSAAVLASPRQVNRSSARSWNAMMPEIRIMPLDAHGPFSWRSYAKTGRL